MTGTASIPDAVVDLMQRPRPVLCLDTCDLLDVIRGFTEGGSGHSKAARSLVEELKSDPDRCQVVVTELVIQEWSQNLDGVRSKMSKFFRETDKRIRQIGDAFEDAAVLGGHPVVGYSELPLVEGLVAIAEALMARSVILLQDDICVSRAIARVLAQKRPSHHGMIKDSLHLEHYLEFSRLSNDPDSGNRASS